jgi:hypothetical protein
MGWRTGPFSLAQHDGCKVHIETYRELLTAFTKDDLKWLGQLAKHIDI